MNVSILLVLMLGLIGLIGNFNAQAMKNFKNIDKFKTSIGKKLLQNSSKKYFSTSGFTSGLFNQKTNAIKSKNLITGKNLSSKYFDSIPKNYSTVPETGNNITSKINEESNDYSKNKLITKDRYYGKNISEVLEEAFTRGDFLKTYKKMRDMYVGQIFRPKKTEETNQYDKYREEKYKQLKQIVKENEGYKKETDDYDNTIQLLKSNEIDNVVEKIEKLEKEINEKYDLDKRDNIPLKYFNNFLDSSLLDSTQYSKAEIIAARITHLMNTKNTHQNKSVEPNNISNNPYFNFAANLIHEKFYNTPDLKALFIQASESFSIPETIDDYLRFLAEPFNPNKENIIQRIFRDVFVKEYLVLYRSRQTAEDFVQFVDILQKVKNDPEFRESVMKRLGLDKAEAKYKEKVEREDTSKTKKSGSFFNTLFGTREYSTTPQRTRSYSTTPKEKKVLKPLTKDDENGIREMSEKYPVIINGDKVYIIDNYNKPITRNPTLQEYWDIKGPNSKTLIEADPLSNRVKEWSELISYNREREMFDGSFINNDEKIFNRWKVLYDLYSLPVDQTVPMNAFYFTSKFSNFYGTKSEKHMYIPTELKAIKILSNIDDESKYHIANIRSKKLQEIIIFGLNENKIKNKVAEFLKETNSNSTAVNESSDFSTIKKLKEEIPDNKEEKNLSIWQRIRNYF